MGFDIYGLDPQTEKGHYFRNNVWHWRPLWKLICVHCEDILTEEDIKAGEWNDGYAIVGKKANKICKRLLDKMEEIHADIKEYEERRAKEKDFNKNYPLTLDNVLDFIEFCRDSGGFTIH